MDPLPFLTEVNRYLHDRGDSYEKFMQTMKYFKSEEISHDCLINMLMTLFEGRIELIIGFNEFLPEETKFILDEDVEALHFVKRVNTTFEDDHGVFIEFLNLIDGYMCKKNSIIDVYKKIGVLFRGHDDLLTEFKSFLPCKTVNRSASPPLDIIPTLKRQRVEEKSVENELLLKTCDEGAIKFFDKVKATVRDHDICQRLMTYLELYHKYVISGPELREMVHGLIGKFLDLVIGFDIYMEESEKIENVCSCKAVDENIEELDFFTGKRITPSYILLPKNWSRKPCEILPDDIECVPYKNVKFKRRFINQSEKRLFKREDESVKLQMKMDLNKDTLETAKDLKKLMKDDEHGVFRLDEHFTKRKMECIKELFKGKDRKFLNPLKENVRTALPIVIKRLESEEEKLKQSHEASKEEWKKVFAKSHQRARGKCRLWK